jgi:signal transduction histidine kinase
MKKNILVNLLVPGQAALRKKVKQLEEDLIEKERILSIISHDLRGPFQNIIGFSEMMATENFLPEDIRRYACLINGQASSAYNLLDFLTDYFKAKKNQVITSINLKEEVNNIIDFFKPSACQKQIKISNFVAREIIIKTDLNALRAVIRNLISNALKFTPSGRGIFISAINADGLLEISVTDSGNGIEKKRLEKIFFKLSSTPGTNREKGSGLGLFICREMAEEMGGKISVHSVLGKGATFTLTLPSNMVE